MTVQPGTQLGIYELTAPLGAGGMAESIERDTKLNREVAIKVLPEAFTTDPDRVACFQRPRADEVAESLSRGFTLSGVLLQAFKDSETP